MRDSSVGFRILAVLRFYILILSHTVMTRRTRVFKLPSQSIGQNRQVLFHHFGPPDVSPIYIQASLHADELPGMLVANHLIKFLDRADALHLIKKEIIVVPYANPIGLSQVLMGNHVGRFNFNSGINFNRDFPDVTSAVAQRIKAQLHPTDEAANVALIRQALREEYDLLQPNAEEKVLKKELLRVACGADIVLDLHCDNDAIMHMYTHDRLYPQLHDLAAELGAMCFLLAPHSGGDPFDEALSCPWATLADQFPQFPIPMACQSVTVELRGQNDVYDELAGTDARGLLRFLAGRGYVDTAANAELSAICGTSLLANCPPDLGLPLTAVDMIEATNCGVVAWKIRPGDRVVKDQLLGEIVCIEDVDAPRTPVVARCDGLVFGMRMHKLAVPGDIIVKVAGKTPLPWRTGNLLTSR